MKKILTVFITLLITFISVNPILADDTETKDYSYNNDDGYNNYTNSVGSCYGGKVEKNYRSAEAVSCSASCIEGISYGTPETRSKTVTETKSCSVDRWGKGETCGCQTDPHSHVCCVRTSPGTNGLNMNAVICEKGTLQDGECCDANDRCDWKKTYECVPGSWTETYETTTTYTCYHEVTSWQNYTNWQTTPIENKHAHDNNCDDIVLVETSNFLSCPKSYSLTLIGNGGLFADSNAKKYIIKKQLHFHLYML